MTDETRVKISLPKASLSPFFFFFLWHRIFAAEMIGGGV